MRLILGIFILFLHVNAKNLDFSSLSSDFVQTITSPEGNSFEYKGKFYAKKPNFVLWSYKTPTEKYIYITNDNVMVVEPELEQVIISKMRNIPNISKLLKNAKKISKNLFKTTFEDVEYSIHVENNKPKSIKYIDKLENKITINFLHVRTNIYLGNKLFEYKIPKDFDVIKQ